jgi:hypothetical protein
MKLRFLFLLSFLTLAWASFAQTEIMNGIVVDSATFAPLPYVSIQIKHTLRGTSTDAQGKFGVQASRRDTLIFSLIGYETIEVPLDDWDANVVRLAERPTLLKSITIQGEEINPYEGLFDDENERIRKQQKIPFYYNRWKKEKVKLGHVVQENFRAQTYIDVVIRNPETKTGLMTKYKLTETEYYNTLADFNAKNVMIMYHLTAPELITLLNTFFSRHANKK